MTEYWKIRKESVLIQFIKVQKIRKKTDWSLGIPFCDFPTHILKLDIAQLPIQSQPMKTRVILAMRREGISNIEDILEHRRELLEYRNIGAQSVRAIFASISRLDYVLRDMSAGT